MKKRKVLSLWKVILLVISGIVGVLGVAGLSLYLMGRFDEKHIEPEKIEFVKTIEEGEGFFNPQTNNFEVSSDFMMTMTSSTTDVTEKNVKLSLKNAKEGAALGYITDGVVIVPETIKLGTPFKVELVKEFDNVLGQTIIKGGVSELVAKSSNNMDTPKTVKIAVDTPIVDFESTITDVNFEQGIYEVVVGSSFEIKNMFFPENSKYLFSDKDREKIVLYSTSNSTYLNYDLNTNTFRAIQESGEKYGEITAYTFLNSYYQEITLSEIDPDKTLDRNEVYQKIFEKRRTNPERFCTPYTIKVRVLSVNVENVTISSGKIFETTPDKEFNLTTVSANGNGSLNLKIKDSSGMNLKHLYKNVGIKLPKKDTLIIEGASVIKVIKEKNSYTITKEPFSATEKYYEAGENIEYYVLPYVGQKNPDDYNWNIYSTKSEDKNVSLSINFFMEENDSYANFFDFVNKGTKDAEPIFSMRFSEPAQHEEFKWTDSSDIKVKLDYDKDGKVIENNVRLDKDLTVLNPDKNLYTLRKYFIVDNEGKDTKIRDSVACKPGVIYKNDYKGNKLEVSNLDIIDSYTFYELETDALLTIRKSSKAKLKVFVAIVKTDAKGNPYKDANGGYLIVRTTAARNLKIDSTFSITNMEATFGFVEGIIPNQDYENEYYIPAINRDNSSGGNNKKDVITFQFVLKNSEDVEMDKNKIIEAFLSKNLRVACLDLTGNETKENCITLSGVEFKKAEETSLIFEGKFEINEEMFVPGDKFIDKGKYVGIELQYNNGKETHKKRMVLKDAEGIKELNHFYIYYQQPVSIKGDYERDMPSISDGNILKDIVVNISATQQSSIKWGNKQLNTNSLDEAINELNTMLKFTLEDQFGNKIDLNDSTYKIRFEENDADKNVLQLSEDKASIKGFAHTKGVEVKTSMTVYVLDNRGNKLNSFDKETGAVKTDLMKVEGFNFSIISEGISKVEYDNEEILEQVEMVESEDKTSLSVSKFATDGDELILKNMFNVYTYDNVEGRDVAISPENIIVKLDNTYISELSQERKIDIVKMVTFDYITDKEPITVASIEDLKGFDISKLHILNVFNEDTAIKFIIQDKDQSLFNINFTLTIKTDIGMTSTFNTYYNERKDYLVKNDEMPSVFAGESYDLDKYLILNSISRGREYKWTQNNFEVSGLFEESSESEGLCKIVSGEAGKALLEIGDVYNFRVIKFTIYYKVNNLYAFNRTISLYLNPNIIVRQTTKGMPHINIAKIHTDDVNEVNPPVEKLFNTYYSFYRATQYIDNGCDFLGVKNLDESAIEFTFVNNSKDKYLKVFNKDNGRQLGFESNASMRILLGGVVNQDLSILVQEKNGQGGIVSETMPLHAIKILDKDGRIYLSSASKETHIDFEMAYGDEDLETVISSIFSKEGQAISSIRTQINDFEILAVVLKPDTEYTLADGFNIITSEGDFENGNLTTSKQHLNKFNTMNIDGLLSGKGEETFVVKRVLKDGMSQQFTIEIVINFVISELGDKFVYYNEGSTVDLTQMKYNKYKNYTFDTLVGDYTVLESNDIYQNLSAGNTYTILHDSNLELLNEKDVYGMYYDANTLGINTEQAKAIIKMDIVSEAKGYVPGLAELKKSENGTEYELIINDISSIYTDSYIVIRCEIVKTSQQTSFVYYYRVKVLPSFEVGGVLYPYSDKDGGLVGEYLETSSKYYVKETKTYNINLEERYNLGNSKYSTGKRFSDLTWINGGTAKEVSAEYSIKSASSNGITIRPEDYLSYFTYGFEYKNGESIFSVKLSEDLNADAKKITITIQRISKNKDKILIGSEMEYIFRFNQSSKYIVGEIQQDGRMLDKNNGSYVSYITAGAPEIKYTSNIKVNNNGVVNNVENLNAYIISKNGENIEEFLMKIAYVEKGVEILDAEGQVTGTLNAVQTIGTWTDKGVDDAIKAMTKENGLVEIKVGEVNKYIRPEDVKFTFSILNNSTSISELVIKPRGSISQDGNFEIGYYSNEIVIAKIDLTIKGYYLIVPEVNFDGGKIYNVFDSGDRIFNQFKIVDSAKGQNPTLDIEKFEFSSLNDSDIYTYKNTEDLECISSKEYFVLKDGEYIKVENPKNEDIAKYYEADLHVSDLYKISPSTQSWKKSTIEFAHLVKDVLFNFRGIITDTDGKNYSFEFKMFVKKSFDPTKYREINDSNERFGQVEFIINIETDVKIRFPELNIVDDGESEYTFTDTQLPDYTVIPEDSVVEGRPEQIDLFIDYSFMGKKLSQFRIKYNYTVKPNVTVSANYPVPDGVNESTVEYLATTKNQDNKYIAQEEKFFIVAAMFSSEQRIKVEKKVPENINENWKIMVSSIQNVNLKITNDDTNKIINDKSSDLLVINTVGRAKFESLKLEFELLESSSDGFVSFEVSVNNVVVEYNVQIITKDTVIKTELNSPNHHNNAEELYAEDLNLYKTKNIFDENRMLKYQFNDANITKLNNLYVKFRSKTDEKEVKIVPIKLELDKGIVVLDLGQGYDGYEYRGTYLSKEDAVIEANKQADESIYVLAPKLTNRIVLYYGDIEIVSRDITIKLKNHTEDTQAATAETEVLMSEYLFTPQDFNGDGLKTLDIIVKNGTNIVSTGAVYNLELKVEFVTENSIESAESLFRVDLKAGEESTLFDLNKFGFKNVRTNKYFTQESFKYSPGEIDLRTYGFSTLQVNNNATVKAVHEKLIKDGYFTGLKPRAGEGFVIDTDSEAANQSLNYIRVAGVRLPNSEVRKVVNYSIKAQGADNLGNHIMMKLVYSVDIGSETPEIVTREYNIMLRILPNDFVLFQAKEGVESYNAGDQIVDRNNIVYESNKNSPFLIYSETNTNSKTINIWDDKTSLIKINLYKKNKELVRDFKYTYTPMTDGYNDMKAFNEAIEDKVQKGTATWEKDGSSYKSKDGISNLSVEMPQLKLGEKNFYIDGINDFGYRIRFYFKNIANVNPEILPVLGGLNLTEGDTIAFGTKFKTVSPKVNTYPVSDYSTAQFVEFDTFEFKAEYQNNATITLKRTEFTHYVINYARVSITKETQGAENTVTVITKTLSCAGENAEAEINFELTNEAGKLSGYWEDKDGNPLQVEDKENENYFVGGKVVFGINVTIVKNDDGSNKNCVVGTYEATLKYGENKESSLAITQGQNISSENRDPDFGAEKDRFHSILIGGIDAYGYSNSLGAIYDPSKISDLKSNKSRINDLTIQKVEYYYNDILISTSGYDDDKDVKLVTSNSHSFVLSDNSIVLGESYVDSMGFAVPNMIGAFYGDKDYIDNVTMKVYIRAAAQVQPAAQQGRTGTVERETTVQAINGVRINKGKSNVKLFDEDVPDNFVLKKSSIETSEPNLKVYNDTLQVDLESNGRAVFAISDEAISDVNYSDCNEIVLENSKNYNKTEYVGISQNIKGMELKNLTPEKIRGKELELSTTVSDVTIEYFISDAEKYLVKEDKKGYDNTIDAFETFKSNGTIKSKKIDLSGFNTERLYIYIKSTDYENTTIKYKGQELTKVSNTKKFTGVDTDGKTDKVYDSEVYEYVTRNWGNLIAGDKVNIYIKELKGAKIRYADQPDITPEDLKRIEEEVEIENRQFEIVIQEIKNNSLKISAPEGKSIEYFISDKEMFIPNVDKKGFASGTNSITYTKFTGTKTTTTDIVDLSKYDSDNVYIYIRKTSDKEASIEYNGKILTVPTDTKKFKGFNAEGTSALDIDSEAYEIVQRLPNIRLKINDVSEMAVPSLNGYKEQKLYFLYSVEENGEVYRKTQTFRIHPNYSNGNPDTSVQEYAINEYLKVAKGTGAGAEEYYIIRFEDWAKNIDIKNYTNSGSTKLIDLKDQLKKFYFTLINPETQETLGSAFVDEFGTIVTKKDFNQQDHYFKLHIYSKISGYDSNYRDVNTSLKIGEYNFYLTKQEIEAFDGIDGGIYKLKDNGIITIPTGYSLFKTKNIGNVDADFITSLSSVVVKPEIPTIGCNKGDVIDFRECYDNTEVFKGMNNLNYHLVGIRKQGSGSVNEIINFANLNIWKFTEAGNFILDIVVSGYLNNGIKVTYRTTTSIFVYENSISESRQYSFGINGDSAEYALSNIEGDGIWYEINGEALTRVEKFKAEKAGIYIKEYLFQKTVNSVTSKTYTITFYVFDNKIDNTATHSGITPIDKKVVLNPQSNFALELLLPESANKDSSYEYYKIYSNDNGTIGYLKEEKFNQSPNTMLDAGYLIVEKNSKGMVVSINRYNVTFMFLQGNTKPTQIFIQNGAFKESLENYFYDQEGIEKPETSPTASSSSSTKTIEIQEIKDGSIFLKPIDASEQFKSIGERRTFVVMVINTNGGVRTIEKYYKCVADIYGYVDKLGVGALDISTGKKEPIIVDIEQNNAYQLSELTPILKNKFNTIDHIKDAISITYYNKKKDPIELVTTIQLDSIKSEEYYLVVEYVDNTVPDSPKTVKEGYILYIKFYVYAQSFGGEGNKLYVKAEKGKNISVETLNETIKRVLEENYLDSNGVYEYSTLNDGVKVSVKTIKIDTSMEKEYFVRVNDNMLYLFKIYFICYEKEFGATNPLEIAVEPEQSSDYNISGADVEVRKFLEKEISNEFQIKYHIIENDKLTELTRINIETNKHTKFYILADEKWYIFNIVFKINGI